MIPTTIQLHTKAAAAVEDLQARKQALLDLFKSPWDAATPRPVTCANVPSGHDTGSLEIREAIAQIDITMSKIICRSMIEHTDIA